MKSAYELAMERLEKDDPVSATPLTDKQKQALGEVDAKYQAKIAEREVFLDKQLLEARRSRDANAVEQVKTQMRNERLRLEEEREAAKNKIRESLSTE